MPAADSTSIPTLNTLDIDVCVEKRLDLQSGMLIIDEISHKQLIVIVLQ